MMIGLFEKCSSLISLPDLSKWNLQKVTSMKDMFSECTSLISLFDLSKWKFSKDILTNYSILKNSISFVNDVSIYHLIKYSNQNKKK